MCNRAVYEMWLSWLFWLFGNGKSWNSRRFQGHLHQTIDLIHCFFYLGPRYGLDRSLRKWRWCDKNTDRQAKANRQISRTALRPSDPKTAILVVTSPVHSSFVVVRRYGKRMMLFCKGISL